MGWSSKWGFPQGPMHVSCIPQNGLLGLRRWIQWRVPGLPCNPRAKIYKNPWVVIVVLENWLYHINKNVRSTMSTRTYSGSPRNFTYIYIYTGAILEIIVFFRNPETREQSQGFKTWWWKRFWGWGQGWNSKALNLLGKPKRFLTPRWSDVSMKFCLGICFFDFGSAKI